MSVDESGDPSERACVGDHRSETLEHARKVDDVALAPHLLIGRPEASRFGLSEHASDASGEVGLHGVVVDQSVVDIDEEREVLHRSRHAHAGPPTRGRVSVCRAPTQGLG